MRQLRTRIWDSTVGTVQFCLLRRCRVCICHWQVAMDRNLQRAQAIFRKKMKLKLKFRLSFLTFDKTHFGGLSSETTHVDRPQNGVNSHDLPGSTVAQRVLAKHIPGKSRFINKQKQ